MPENKVSIEVSVTATGVEALQKVDTSMTALAKTTDKSTAITKKENDLLATTNTSLSKQVPWLKDLNPLWNNLGISWLTSAGAIGAVGLGLLKTTESIGSMQGGAIGLGVAMNTQTVGPMMSYSDMMARLTELSDEYGVSVLDLEGALKNMNPNITDQQKRWDILTEALKLHNTTGADLDTTVKALSDSYAGTTQVIDKNTGATLRGNDAQVQTAKNIEVSQGGMQRFKSLIGDFVGKTWSDFIQGLQSGHSWFEKLNISIIGLANPVLAFKIVATKVFQEVWDFLQAKFDIEGWFKGLADKAGNVIENVFGPKVRAAFEGIFNWISAKISALWDAFNALLSFDFGGVGNAMGKLFGKDETNTGSTIPPYTGNYYDENGNVISKADYDKLISSMPETPVLDSYASGTDFVPQTGPYLLHRGESVTPSGDNNRPINLYLGDGTLIARWVMGEVESLARLRGAY